MKRLLLLLLIAFPLSLFAGHEGTADFVILHSNDTLYGSVENFDLQTTPREITFSREKEIKTFAPEDIRAFLVHRQGIDHYFESHTLTASQLKKLNRNSATADEMIFLYVYLKDSPMSLYFHQDQKPVYFIQRNNEALAELEKPAGSESPLAKYKRILSYYLADLPNGANKIRAVRYNSQFLTRLLLEYNLFKSADNTAAFIFEPHTSMRSKFGIVTGLSYSFFNFSSHYAYFDYLIEGAQSTALQPAIGLSYTVPLSELVPNILLYNEISYRSYNTRLTYINQEDYWTYRTQSHLEAAYGKLSSMVRWKGAERAYTPFVQLGLWGAYSFSQTRNSKLIERSSRAHENYSFISEDQAFGNYKKMEGGPAIGIGLNRKKLSTEFRFEGGSGMSNYRFLRATSYTASLLVQYQL